MYSETDSLSISVSHAERDNPNKTRQIIFVIAPEKKQVFV